MDKNYKRYSGKGHPNPENPLHKDLKQYKFAYGTVYARNQKEALQKLKNRMKSHSKR